MALQKSTSKPCHWPASLGVANPAAWEMPHLTVPRARIARSVAPGVVALVVSVADVPELDVHATIVVIPSAAAKRRRRGIAILPVEGSRSGRLRFLAFAASRLRSE